MYRPEALVLPAKIIFSHRATVSGNKLLPVNEWITLVIGVGYFCSSAAVWGKIKIQINRSCTIRAVSLAWGNLKKYLKSKGHLNAFCIKDVNYLECCTLKAYYLTKTDLKIYHRFIPLNSKVLKVLYVSPAHLPITHLIGSGTSQTHRHLQAKKSL